MWISTFLYKLSESIYRLVCLRTKMKHVSDEIFGWESVCYHVYALETMAVWKTVSKRHVDFFGNAGEWLAPLLMC